MNKITPIIANRPVGIMVHGGSISQLETVIKEYEFDDICWASLGLFTVMEEHILSKINRKLDILFDCATVSDARKPYYESRVRFPRVEEFLSRNQDNLWITTNGLIRDSLNVYRPDLHRYGHKIARVDDLFPKREIGFWMDVPNSVTLLIGSMIAGGASKIFIFGLDGYKGEVNVGLSSCYRPEEIAKERLAALGSDQDPGINRDTSAFEKRFDGILRNYRRLFNNQCPIYNVSPNSVYENIRKIDYSSIRNFL